MMKSLLDFCEHKPNFLSRFRTDTAKFMSESAGFLTRKADLNHICMCIKLGDALTLTLFQGCTCVC